ncbi:MAG: hypothetical protein OHK003_04760 [Anaerolineales bacterium]
MNNTEQLELYLEVQAGDLKDDELDSLTRRLLSELKELDIESASLARKGELPEGSKGDPVTIGAIVLVVLPSVLPKIVEFLQAWSLRGNGRTVKFKGKGIEFEGPPEELQKLLDKLGREKKKK